MNSTAWSSVQLPHEIDSGGNSDATHVMGQIFGACRPTRPEYDALVCLKWHGWRHSFRSRQSVHYSVPPIIILHKTGNFLYGTANVLYTEQNIFLYRLSFEHDLAIINLLIV